MREALEARPRRGRDAKTRDDDPGEQVEQLAHHALRGEVWDKAWQYGAHAAIRAAQRGANREAVAFFEQAHAALERLPETAETRGHAVDLLVGLRNALQALGEFSRGFDCLRRAEAIAEALGDRPRPLEIAGAFTGHFWTAGDQDSALDAARRALAIATDLAEPDLVTLGRHLVGRILAVRGEYRAAIDMLGSRTGASTAPPPAAVPSPRGARAKPAWMLQVDQCFSYANLANCLAEVVDFDAAVAAGQRASEVAEAIDRHYSRVVARAGLGTARLRRGRLDEAMPVLDGGLALCEQMQILVLFPWVAAPAGYATALAGRVADGRRLLELAVERAGAMRMLVYQSQRIAWLGEVSLYHGDADEAVRLGERALELARAHGERGNEAWALRLAGVIQASRGGGGERDARDFFEQALAMAGELGLSPLAAHCHLALAALLVDEGDAAARHAATGATLMREMAMRVRETPPGPESADPA